MNEVIFQSVAMATMVAVTLLIISRLIDWVRRKMRLRRRRDWIDEGPEECKPEFRLENKVEIVEGDAEMIANRYQELMTQEGMYLESVTFLQGNNWPNQRLTGCWLVMIVRFQIEKK